MPIDATIHVTLAGRAKFWQFPRSRFVEYDDGDESWARALGFGREVECGRSIEFDAAPEELSISASRVVLNLSICRAVPLAALFGK